MNHFLSSFGFDLPNISAKIYDISSELSDDPYSELSHFENVLHDMTDGHAHRIRGGDGEWYVCVFGHQSLPKTVNANGTTLRLTYQTSLDADNPRHRRPLEQALRNALRSYLTSELDHWEYNERGDFYESDPIQTVTGEEARFDVYRGVRTSISYRIGSGFMLNLDPTRKFVDERTLADRLRISEASAIIDRFGSSKRYFFFDKPGPQPVRLQSISDASVTDETMSIDGVQMSVLEFVERNYGSKYAGKIDPTDRVVKVSYRPGGRLYDAAPSLLRLIPHQEEVTTQASTLPADERWSEVQEWKRPIKYLRLGAHEANLADDPIDDGLNVFDFPRLCFANDAILEVGSSIATGSGSVTRDGWVYSVLDYLQEFGPRRRPMDEPWVAVLYSDSMRETAFEALDDLRDYLRTYANIELKEHPGGVSFDHRDEFREWQDEFSDQVSGALAYMAGDTGNQYHEVINAIEGKPVQHLRHDNYRQERGRSDSYSLRNAATDFASKLGVRPFLLADGLNADAVIGLSVTGDQQTTACSVTVSGQTGDVINWTDKPHGRGSSTVTDFDHAERLTGDGIIAASNEIDETISSVVIHRNGKFGNEEVAGISSAIETLKADGHIENTFRWSAVELLDNTPYRIYSDGADRYCETGAYARIDDSTILVAPSGRAYTHQGTPRTFQIRVKDGTGDIDIREIGKDVFDLTFLSWWAPGSKISSPITTRYPSEMNELFEHCPQLQFLPS